MITELNNTIENPDATGYNHETRKIVSQEKIEGDKMKNTCDIEMFKSVLEAGQSAIKYSFLLNGGASVAMLAFISALFTSTKTEIIPYIANSLASFSLGTLLVAIAAGTRYLGQLRYQHEVSTQAEAPTQGKLGHIINFITIALVFFSYCCFFWGMYVAYETFASLSIKCS